MVFNLGAFAGGLAQSGMKTYSTLEEIERQKAAAAREEARLEFERERMGREREQYGQTQQAAQLLKQAYTPTEGGTSVQDVGAALPIGVRAGEDTTTPEYRAAFQQALAGMTPDQQAAVLRGYGDINTPGGKIASAMPDLKAAQLGTTTVRQDENGQNYAVQPLTGEKAAERFQQLAGAAGNPVAIEKALGLRKTEAELAAAKQNIKLNEQTYDLNGFKLKKAQTEQQFDERFQGALQDVMTESAKTLDKIKTTAETGGMKGLVDAFGPQLKEAFKHDISLVGNSIIVKGSDGKTLHTINSTAEAVNLLEGAAKEQFNKNLSDKMVSSGLFRNPEELNAFVKNQRDYNIAQMNSVSERMKAEASQSNAATTASELAAKVKANLFGAQANQANAAAGASQAHAKYFDAEAGRAKLQVTLLQSDQAARTAAQPFLDEYAKLTPAEQKGEKGIALIEKAAVTAATKSTDFSRLLTATGANKTPKPEISNADVLNFVKENGDADSSVRNPKNNDKFFKIRELPLDQQRAAAEQFYMGKAAGGLPAPDISNMQKPGAAPAASALPAATGPSIQSQIATAQKPISPDFESAQMQAQRNKVIDSDPMVLQAKAAIKQNMGRGGSIGLSKAQELQKELDAYIARKYPASSFQAMPSAQ
jgi:hypothetical protein